MNIRTPIKLCGRHLGSRCDFLILELPLSLRNHRGGADLVPYSPISLLPYLAQASPLGNYLGEQIIRQIPKLFRSKGKKVAPLAPIVERALEEEIPHIDLTQNQPKKAKMKRANKPPRQKKKQNGQRKPRVKVSPVGYPAIQNTLENNSLTVAAPTNRTNIKRSGLPRLSYLPNGDCRIRHREFVQDITGQIAQNINTFPINPGLVLLFPWLSRIAGNFESYQFYDLCFRFETEASSASTGTVLLSVDYDASDAPPTTKQQALAYRGAVRSSPWCACVHTSIKEDLTKRKSYFVRAGGLSTSNDITLYDTGNLFVMTIGQVGTAVVGELWVEYDIKLMTPRSLSAGGGNAVWGRYFLGVDNSQLAVYNSGNLPVTQVNSGTTTAVSTWTFQQPWQGVITANIGGTGIGVTTVTGTGGVTAFASNTNAGSTGITLKAEINAVQGQTVILTVNNSTLTSASIYFMQGLGAYQ